MEAKELLTRGVVECVVREHLEKRLESGEKLTVKLGIDPTGAELHLGHAVILRRLREFSRLGHRVVLIIGDFTAQIGDPSDREAERQPLSREEIESNMSDYLDQVKVVLGEPGTDFEVRHNSEWLEELGAQGIVELMATATWQQLAQRSSFKKRMEAGQDVTMLEVSYPLLQGYDSVAIQADLEVGGTDQSFNLLMGRQVQKRYGREPQDILTFQLLEGTDGRKMSKSYGNHIALRDVPAEMYGKVMRVRDDLVEGYFLLTTDLSNAEIQETADLSLRDQKARLAREIVTLYHGADQATVAEAEFNRVFRDKETPSDVTEYALENPTGLVDLLEVAGLVASKSEARRLIDQGGVKLDGVTLDSYDHQVSSGTLQVGKRRFLKVSSKQ